MKIEVISHKFLIKKGLTKGMLSWAVRKKTLIIANKGEVIDERTYISNSPYLTKFKQLFASNVMTLEELNSHGVSLKKMVKEVRKQTLLMDCINGRYVFNVDESPFIRNILKKQLQNSKN